jgi:ADP-ribosyl-[dinitrogen reductase] hydrolase
MSIPFAPWVPQSQRLAGGIWGLLVGDALGVPYEFVPPKRIPMFERIEMTPPLDFLRSHSGVPVGTWSDDGAQALCLLDTLLEKETMDLDELMRKMRGWYLSGLHTPDRIVFDIGFQTQQALEAFGRGKPALEAAHKGERANGNGSLMRVLPLALWHTGSDAELVRDALLQSIGTHGHVRAGVCCAFLCLWARGFLEGRADAWELATDRIEGIFLAGTPEREELDKHVQPREVNEGKGSGYVVDCLWSARQAMREPTFERVVKAAVALGYDTDTTACVAGGMAGVRDGTKAIPERWMKAMRGKDHVNTLVSRLLDLRVGKIRDREA